MLQAEFEISAQTACAAQAAKQYVKPAAAELTQLMGSAEFENEQICCKGTFPALLDEWNFIKNFFYSVTIKIELAWEFQALPGHETMGRGG